MKREFGKKLIEEFFAAEGGPDPRHRHLRRLHPRPRHADRDPGRPQHDARRRARSAQCSAYAASRLSPKTQRKGHVWRAIVDQIDQPGSDSEWVTVADRRANRLAAHPWSLSGGGAGDLMTAIEAVRDYALAENVRRDRHLAR